LKAIQRSLGDEVLGGAADLVRPARTLFVSPDGFYAGIPFGVLELDEALLVEHRDVILVPSASLLVLERARARADCAGAARVLALSAPRGLPGAHDEINRLAQRYRRVERSPALDADALAAVLRPCDVLHVASHALVLDRSPWDSGIRVAAPTEVEAPAPGAARAGGTRSDVILNTADSMLVARTFPGDPYLRAWRIAGLSIRARLAVLAACETAGGRMTNGEGTLGITAAFLSAGVPVVVSSLWPVDDRATERIMSAFYHRLASGLPVATALREAQLEVSRAPDTAHPFLWAGFTVVGDGTGSIPIQRRPDPLLPALVLLLASLAATVAIVRRRRARAAMR
jgi:CHAT domain-containing protein